MTYLILRDILRTSAALLAFGLLFGSLSQAQQPIRQVEDSLLPRGSGFAHHFKTARELANHTAVIFADDFESGPLGQDWDETRNPSGKVLELVDLRSDSAPVGNRSLQVAATLGENTGGGMTRWFESNERLFIRFYTKFDNVVIAKDDIGPAAQ